MFEFEFFSSVAILQLIGLSRSGAYPVFISAFYYTLPFLWTKTFCRSFQFSTLKLDVENCIDLYKTK